MSGPKIYSCAEWRARPAQEFSRTDPEGIVVHHTAGPNRALIGDPKKALEYAFGLAQDIQAYHMDVQGWGDSGQNFLVTRDGIILESRHGSIAAIKEGESVRGAHAGDQEGNTWPGIEVEGTYTNHTPSQPQWQALVALCAWICRKCKIQSSSIHGHREFVATACPGNAFFGELGDLRKAVKEALTEPAQATAKPPGQLPPKPATKVKVFANDRGVSAASLGILYDVESLTVNGQPWKSGDPPIDIVAVLGLPRK